MDQSKLQRAAERLRFGERICVLTGAGVSAESGIPTFRDALQGLWAKYDPAELATPEAFERDPATVSRWYDERRLKTRGCEPNAGHRALAGLERRLAEGGRSLTILTQNVDRLHQRAGSREVVELHGSLHVWRCTETGAERELPSTPLKTHPMRTESGGLLRPGVVWFGETLPPEALRRAEEATSACDVFLSIGTSAVVHPAAGFCYAAKESGAFTIEINRDPTPVTELVDLALQGRAGEILPALVDAGFP